MEKPIKSASSLILPLIPNQPVKITLSSGQSAQTYPESIDRIEYSNGMLFITFTTGSSIYDKVPVKVKEVEGYYNGQVIANGTSVKTPSYTITVQSILQILEDKILIKDTSGATFATPIFLA